MHDIKQQTQNQSIQYVVIALAYTLCDTVQYGYRECGTIQYGYGECGTIQ